MENKNKMLPPLQILYVLETVVGYQDTLTIRNIKNAENHATTENIRFRRNLSALKYERVK